MKRELWSILGNGQLLDGGAMFGNAPKALWSRWSPADTENRIELACRCLFVREVTTDALGNETERRLLFETGIGAFFDEELRQRFGVTSARHLLVERLAALGFPADTIDVVVLSHLHFDHAGGLLSARGDGEARLVFENAVHIVGREAFERACRPHPRDRASYIEVLHPLLEKSGRLELVDSQDARDRVTCDLLGPDWSFFVSHGHSPGMLLARLSRKDGPIVFAADLVPGLPWVRRAITMGYDRYPELLIDEKTAVLEALVAEGGQLFFTHDPEAALSSLGRDAKGQIVPAATMGELVGFVA